MAACENWKGTYIIESNSSSDSSAITFVGGRRLMGKGEAGRTYDPSSSPPT